MKKIIAFLIVLIVLIWFGINPDKSFDELAPIYAQSPSKFMDVSGQNVHYRDEGEGFPIVLIHGTGASLHTWDEWTKKLTETHRVIRFDLPAYGLTGMDSEKRYSLDDYRVFLDTFLNHLGVEKFHLAGNSLGGAVSWLYASHYPKKVDKLILIDPSGFPGRSTPGVIQLAKTPLLNQFVRYVTPRFFIEKNLKEVYEDDRLITDELINRYWDLTRYSGNRQAFIDRAKLPTVDSSPRLQYIESPTLILWGDKDAWIPVENALKFDQAISQSTVVILPDAGHVPMEEFPLESVKIALDFLEN